MPVPITNFTNEQIRTEVIATGGTVAATNYTFQQLVDESSMNKFDNTYLEGATSKVNITKSDQFRNYGCKEPRQKYFNLGSIVDQYSDSSGRMYIIFGVSVYAAYFSTLTFNNTPITNIASTYGDSPPTAGIGIIPSEVPIGSLWTITYWQEGTVYDSCQIPEILRWNGTTFIPISSIRYYKLLKCVDNTIWYTTMNLSSVATNTVLTFSSNSYSYLGTSEYLTAQPTNFIATLTNTGATTGCTTTPPATTRYYRFYFCDPDIPGAYHGYGYTTTNLSAQPIGRQIYFGTADTNPAVYDGFEDLIFPPSELDSRTLTITSRMQCALPTLYHKIKNCATNVETWTANRIGIYGQTTLSGTTLNTRIYHLNCADLMYNRTGETLLSYSQPSPFTSPISLDIRDTGCTPFCFAKQPNIIIEHTETGFHPIFGQSYFYRLRDTAYIPPPSGVVYAKISSFVANPSDLSVYTIFSGDQVRWEGVLELIFPQSAITATNNRVITRIQPYVTGGLTGGNNCRACQREHIITFMPVP